MDRLFWIDLEMTGLDENTCVILEAAALVSDLDFKVLEEYEAIVRQPQAVLDAMDDWCKKTHGESGLSAKVPHGKPIEVVESDLLAMIGRHFSADERIILCGNSINTDRRFLVKGMPTLGARLHYRVIDVTSFKEIFLSKFKVRFDKVEGHRALDDIRESMEELRHYMSYVVPREGDPPGSSSVVATKKPPGDA